MSGAFIWQAIGWLALALNVWGNLQLTGRGRAGWLVRLAVNVLWIGYAVDQHAWALLANHAVFVPINIFGWLRWRPTSETSEAKEIRRLREGLTDIEKRALGSYDYRVARAARIVLAD